jgi:hypothetical protein
MHVNSHPALLTASCSQRAIRNRVFVQEPEVQIIQNPGIVAKVDAHLRSVMHLESQISTIHGGFVVCAKYGISIYTQC